MAKVKYRYNPETLSYDIITVSVKERLIKMGIMIAISILVSIIYFAIYSHFFDTPKERTLSVKLSKIKFDYQVLSQELVHIDQLLSDIQKRDDNLYRTVLECDPIPASIRQAGFGGVNRYQHLEGYMNSGIMIAASKHTEKIMKQLSVQSLSYDELIDKTFNREQMLASRPAILPIPGNKLKRISKFGMRLHPKLGYWRMHTGMDLSADTGTAIYSTGDGKVLKAEYNGGGYGNMVVIDHGFGYQTLYGHMNSIGVLVGSEVKRGQVIGTVGSTGLSVGPHLHYEVHKNGYHVNPINYFYIDLSPDEYGHLVERSHEDNEILEDWSNLEEHENLQLNIDSNDE